MAFKFNKTVCQTTRRVVMALEMSDNGNVSTLKYVVPRLNKKWRRSSIWQLGVASRVGATKHRFYPGGSRFYLVDGARQINRRVNRRCRHPKCSRLSCLGSLPKITQHSCWGGRGNGRTRAAVFIQKIQPCQKNTKLWLFWRTCHCCCPQLANYSGYSWLAVDMPVLATSVGCERLPEYSGTRSVQQWYTTSCDWW